MDSALPEHQTWLTHPTWGNRLVSFLLAAATTLLIALMMLAMGAFVPSDKDKVSRLVAMQFPEPAGAKSQPKRAAARHSAAPPRAQPVPQPPVIKPPVPVTQLLHMSKQEYAASDISNLPKHAEEGSSDNASGNSASTYGPGDGPGGVHLYNAEWYREPSHAELATYLSKTSAQGEWAMIACKTIEHYHVENCQEMDESPPGSGLARALRQAAWQFLVRPPRVDGHVMIGAWVKIKFTFTRSLSSGPAESTLPGADEGH